MSDSLTNGALTLDRSTVTGSSTLGIPASGGAIFSESGEVPLISSTLSGNRTMGADADGVVFLFETLG